MMILNGMQLRRSLIAGVTDTRTRAPKRASRDPKPADDVSSTEDIGRRLTAAQHETLVDAHTEPIQDVLQRAGLSRNSALLPDEIERADILAEEGWPEWWGERGVRNRIMGRPITQTQRRG